MEGERKVESATTDYHQALSLAEELSMRPLQAHCHRESGQPLCKDGTSRAGPRRAVYCYGALPSHGHDLPAP